MRILFLLSCLLYFQSAIAQKLEELRHCKTTDYKCDFYISYSRKKMKYEDTLHYFWFKAQKIHATQGSSEGNLLHNSYTKFYHSGQMAERGKFERGLKDGQWKAWYESGNLKSIYNYSQGVLAGAYALFNEAGDISESGKIKRGEKNLDKKRVKRIRVKKDWSGTRKLSEEKLKEKQEKKEIREQKKREREYRREKDGNFIQRLFNKDKSEKPEKVKNKINT